MTALALAARAPNAVPLRETICLGDRRMIGPEVGGLPCMI